MKPRALTLPLSLLAVGTLAACGGDEVESTSRMTAVDVTVVSPVTTPGFATAPGTVAASEEAELATRISGTIRRIEVDVGARVSSGDTLIVLDTEEIDARIRGAEAAARLARRSYERIASLARDGAATPQELDDALARLEMSESALNDLRAQRKYVVLPAPFDGVITSRRADPGDLAVPGSAVLTILGMGSLKIEADLPGDLVSSITPGDPAVVTIPADGSRYAARVSRVVPALDRASRRFRVELRLDPDAADIGVPPGTFVRLEIENAGGTTRWIPRDALVRQGQLTGVFVVEDGHLRLRWIRPGQFRDDGVELLAGPATDALIVRSPDRELKDGQPVAEVRHSEWNPPTGAVPRSTPERIG